MVLPSSPSPSIMEPARMPPSASPLSKAVPGIPCL
jgi:hypothetical protein